MRNGWMSHCRCYSSATRSRTSNRRRGRRDEESKESQGNSGPALLIKLARPCSAVVIDVDHLHIRIKIQRSRALLALPYTGRLHPAERYLSLAANRRGVDMHHARLDPFAKV